MIASMPVKLYKIKQGDVEEVTDDPRVRMLNSDTGDTLDAYQMKKAMVEDYLMGQGGYCYIDKAKNKNEVTGLYYVEEIFVEVMKNYEPIFKNYRILVMGKQFYPEDFIKLLRNTKDGARGIGLTEEVSKALETAYQTLRYQLGLVKSGGNKKGFLKSTRKLGQDELNVLKQAWRKLYQENNEENVIVLNNGIEFQEASNSSVEMQLNESKKTLMDEINYIFHIYDDFDKTFKLGIYPIVKAFETALNRDLLFEKEKGKYFFEFDVKEIVKASLKERYESYKLAKETGFLTVNEIRREENRNRIEGLDVVNVGLGAVLYDTNTHTFYTPNTGDTQNFEQKEDDMLEGHELAQEFDASGNSSDG
jgi:HK97 family phage portal protein